MLAAMAVFMSVLLVQLVTLLTAYASSEDPPPSPTMVRECFMFLGQSGVCGASLQGGSDISNSLPACCRRSECWRVGAVVSWAM
jgi:hypothetical protein